MSRAMVALVCAPILLAQNQDSFAVNCAACHGADARGSAQSPGLSTNPRVAEQSQDQLRAYLRQGNPNAGMPSFGHLSDTDLTAVTRFLRRLNAATVLTPPLVDPGAAKITIGAPQPGDWR